MRWHLALESVYSRARSCAHEGETHLFPAKLAPAVFAVILTVFGLQGLSGSTPAAAQEGITKTWAMAEFGKPLYKDGFEHWPYANPNAPKGGKIVLGAFGSFDSLNALILKGEWPRSIGLIRDSLMVNSADELASAYGLIAETVEFPADKSWIIFNLRPEARYHDGVPIVAEDFKAQFEAMMEHGRPFLKSFFREVEGVEVLSDHRLKFTFSSRNSMKPLMQVATSVPPLPRHYWATRDITRTYLEPPLGSGAYRIKTLEAGRTITYERVEDYWAADLNIMRGLNNFDEIRFDYFREGEVMFEAFKAGALDFRAENSSKRWATGYKVPQVERGEIVKRLVPDHTPSGIQAFFFNLRRDKFKDVRVREGIAALYDFESVRRSLLFNQYTRIKSYFPNSDFGVSGPPTPEEIAILKPFADRLPPEVMTKAFEPPKTDGTGNIRTSLRKAVRLFKQAGWELKSGKLIDPSSGEQMKIEFLVAQADAVRLTAPFINNLKRAGIDANVRIVDTSQYQVRIDDFDFDIISVRLNFFPPPGPELRSYYGSAAAVERGSANMAGIENPVADELIERIIAAKDLETLKATSRALDRVLLWQHYVVPQFYNKEFRLAYWNKFGYPEVSARYSHGFPTSWWLDRTLEAKLNAR